jgi:hypothetical protein
MARAGKKDAQGNEMTGVEAAAYNEIHIQE